MIETTRLSASSPMICCSTVTSHSFFCLENNDIGVVVLITGSELTAAAAGAHFTTGHFVMHFIGIRTKC